MRSPMVNFWLLGNFHGRHEPGQELIVRLNRNASALGIVCHGLPPIG
jgi:hypothetical protein